MSTERKPIDWTKPIVFRNDMPARFISQLNCEHKMRFVCAIGEPGSEEVAVFDECGYQLASTKQYIRNVPERRVVGHVGVNRYLMRNSFTREDAEAGSDDYQAIVTIYECDGKYTAEVEHVGEGK